MVGISCPPLMAITCAPLVVLMMFAQLAHVTSAQNLPSLGSRAVDDANSWVIAGNFIVVGGTLVSTGEPFYNGIVSNGMSRTSRFSELSSSPLPYVATGPAFSVADVVRGRILVCYSGSTNASTHIRRSCLGITAPVASTFASRAQTGAAASEQWAECFPVNNVPRYSALVVASSTYLYVIGGTDVSTGALVQSYEQAPLADACTTTVAWTTVEYTSSYTINATSGVISSPVTNAIPIVATAAFSRSLYATVIGGSSIAPHIAAFPIDDQGVISFTSTISYLTGSTSAPNPGGQATAIWDLVIFSQYQGQGTVAQVHGTLYYVSATAFPASTSLSSRPAAVGYLGAYFSLVEGTNDVLIVPAFPSLPPIEITSPAQITVGDTVMVSTTAGNEGFVLHTGLEVILAPTQACDSVWAACAKSSSDSSSSAGSTTWACDTVGTTVPEGETQLLYLCFGVAPSADKNTVLSTTGGCLASGYTLQTVWGDQSSTSCYSRDLTLTERSWSLATDQVIEVFAVTTTTTTTTTAVPTTTMTTATTSTTTTTTIAPTTTTTTTTTTTETPTSTATSSTSTTEAPTSTTTTTTTAPTSTTTSAPTSTSTATPTTSTSTTPLTTTSTTTVEPTTTSTTTTTTTTMPPNTTTIAPNTTTTTTTTTAAPPPTNRTTAGPAPTNGTTPGPAPTNATPTGPPPSNATPIGPPPSNGTIPAPLPAPSGLSTYVICLIAIGGLIGIAAVAVAIHRCCGCGAAGGSADDNGDEGFGQYRLKSKIAHGGQGTVYLMERRHDLHEYALKFIVCHDNKDRMAALQEFEIMQSCKGHSNMIELVDMFMNWEEEDEVKVAPPAPLREKLSSEEMEADLLIQRGSVSDTAALASLTHSPRFVAIVTEYYPAGSLQKYIVSRTSPIPETVVWSCVFQVANLLHFLHSRSPPVIHQDIKPENVLVDLKTNRLVVTDFGLAARLTPYYKSKSNGTRFYMSPEANSGTPNEKTDIWALGCMLYVLCNRTAAVEKGEKCFFLDVRKDEFEDELMHELEELGYSTALADLCVNMLKLKTDDRLCAEEVIMCCQRECSGLDKATF